jgi:hypothetical protein
MAVSFSASRAGRALIHPKKILVLMYVRGRIDPRTIVLLEAFGQLKKSSNFIGNKTS